MANIEASSPDAACEIWGVVALIIPYSATLHTNYSNVMGISSSPLSAMSGMNLNERT